MGISDKDNIKAASIKSRKSIIKPKNLAN